MCAKVISISYTCWVTYNNQKTTLGQEVDKFYPFQALFLAYWGFKNTRLKWQILPRVWVVQRQNAFSFRGLRPPEPLTKGFAPGPRWGFATDPCYRLALRARHESYSRLLSTPLFSTWRRPWICPNSFGILFQLFCFVLHNKEAELLTVTSIAFLTRKITKRQNYCQ